MTLRTPSGINASTRTFRLSQVSDPVELTTPSCSGASRLGVCCVEEEMNLLTGNYDTCYWQRTVPAELCWTESALSFARYWKGQYNSVLVACHLSRAYLDSSLTWILREMRHMKRSLTRTHKEESSRKSNALLQSPSRPNNPMYVLHRNVKKDHGGRTIAE